MAAHPAHAAPILARDEPFPPNRLAIYLHIPFCQARCTYCDFNTFAGLARLMAPYLRALQREIRLVGGAGVHSADTLYFGGGTPSLVPAHDLAATLETCAAAFAVAPDAEISLEANPGTVSLDYLRALRGAGVNRLSLGMQSANARELRLFGRQHTLADVRAAVRMARAAGFDNVNLDLIYGIPRQTLRAWQHSLNEALTLDPEHLSLYSLSIEEGTPLHRRVVVGELPAPDPDRAADLYEWASNHLAAAGYEQYEISNWARPGFACRHNVHVWRNYPYLGFGAGAHGYAGSTRYANVTWPATYIARIEAQQQPLPFPLSAAADEVHTVDEQQAMAETMLMGLRLVQEGVAARDFRQRFGRDLWDVYGAQLDRLIGVGLLERTPDGRVRLTPRGRLLGNRVFVEFV